jgi:hypothetical protein
MLVESHGWLFCANYSAKWRVAEARFSYGHDGAPPFHFTRNFATWSAHLHTYRAFRSALVDEVVEFNGRVLHSDAPLTPNN